MATTDPPIPVLLVGPEPDAAERAAAALEREDDRLTVDLAADPDETLDRLVAGSYDCVVAVARASGGATSLHDRVRAHDPDLPFVVYVDDEVGGDGLGSDDAVSAREALSAGVTDYVRRDPATDGDAVLAHRVATAVESARTIREAERRRDRLERFVEVVSHDLRNPLSVAQGRLELARAERDDEHLEPAADAVDRSLALIGDLLTLAREGETIAEIEPIALADAVEASWTSVETADATLVVETDGEIRGHPGRVRQLLENLLGNGVHHGGDDVTVRVGTVEPMYTSTRAESHGGAGFYVADDGPGIPKTDRERVFETGYTTAEDGTGFGLNIAKEIAEAHGWEIRVEESREGGARFEVTGVDVVG
ncbi:sensor histidine kinase [Halorubrum cibi]|uniref:histidine kinase n=1 Tax=Halorubrum cibi TaxID=413815 RepID=A0A521DWD8_9EURY|nr:HAMP domain-containing sensor histidine kinase [Halorubrum cibi]SMO75411.1 Signal transduction histidine kinase [Halorubrum cibi]